MRSAYIPLSHPVPSQLIKARRSSSRDSIIEFTLFLLLTAMAIAITYGPAIYMQSH
jgi:hypothetical protein